jgi:hypothetical protein
MLAVSGHTSWKKAFIQTAHKMPRGVNVFFICPILTARSFHLLVRSSAGGDSIGVVFATG